MTFALVDFIGTWQTVLINYFFEQKEIIIGVGVCSDLSIDIQEGN